MKALRALGGAGRERHKKFHKKRVLDSRWGTGEQVSARNWIGRKGKGRIWMGQESKGKEWSGRMRQCKAG